MPKQVWIYAENTARAGRVVVNRWEDFDDEPDSDDFLTLDLEDAKLYYATCKIGTFWRTAAENALEYFDDNARSRE